MPDIKTLSREELDRVPADVVLWVCCVKGCSRHTRLRDFGTAPEYYHNKLGWQNLYDRVFFCGGHWKGYERLCKQYGIEKTQAKLIDHLKQKIICK